VRLEIIWAKFGVLVVLGFRQTLEVIATLHRTNKDYSKITSREETSHFCSRHHPIPHSQIYRSK
jgi:hypothetical protein